MVTSASDAAATETSRPVAAALSPCGEQAGQRRRAQLLDSFGRRESLQAVGRVRSVSSRPQFFEERGGKLTTKPDEPRLDRLDGETSLGREFQHGCATQVFALDELALAGRELGQTFLDE